MLSSNAFAIKEDEAKGVDSCRRDSKGICICSGIRRAF